jgi:hypothetical protein
MIRRMIGNEYWLFTQPDHAKWAGEVARHLGNDRFSPPTRESVITGCAEHDAGWPIHDDVPRINKNHQPMDVFEVPPFLAFAIWSESSRRAAAIDPYAGLLVSLHGFSISIFASTNVAKAHPHLANDTSYRFELNKFQHAQVELQESLRQQLGMKTDIPLQAGLSVDMDDPRERELLFDFRILQATDRLNLSLLCEASPFKSMELLPTPDADSVEFSVNRVNDFELRIAPWPFDEPEISIPIPCRRIPKIAYTDDAHLRREYAAAKEESIDTFLSEKG